MRLNDDSVHARDDKTPHAPRMFDFSSLKPAPDPELGSLALSSLQMPPGYAMYHCRVPCMVWQRGSAVAVAAAVLLCCCVPGAVAAISANERAALEAFYVATGGPSWGGTITGWLPTSPDPCASAWTGVACIDNSVR
jgi:hypothetical protein